MNGTARERLVKAQGDLVMALVGKGPIPAGFDEARVRATARSLVNKRRQALARAGRASWIFWGILTLNYSQSMPARVRCPTAPLRVPMAVRFCVGWRRSNL